MPEDNPTNGVEVSEVSPASESQVATVEPPAGENPVQAEPENSGHVPYIRFKEVNDKMRSFESELAKLRSEKELASKAATSVEDLDETEEEQMSKYAKILEEKGLDPKTSAALSQVIKDISKQEAKGRFAKESAKAEARATAKAEETKKLNAQAAQDIQGWQEGLRKEHPDYAKYEPQMQKEWESLDPGARMALVSSKKAMEMLYKVAKSADVEPARAEGEEKGREEAYKTKGLKSALSSLPGATADPHKAFTAEDVGNMSKEFYTANKDKILKDLGYK